jgi:hypothetical protein
VREEFMRQLSALVVVWTCIVSSSAFAQLPVPALVTGQSNACYLSSHLPTGSHALACQGGASIAAWEANRNQPMAAAVAELLVKYDPQVIVWWQGEADTVMPYAEYAARMLDALTRLAVRADGSLRPIMIVQIARSDLRPQVDRVHRDFAGHPIVAYIATEDLPPEAREDGTFTDHFAEEAYDTVTSRLVACYNTACWLRQ